MLSNLDKMHVIAVISNPELYKSRYNLYKLFEDDIVRKGAKLWTLEMATGARLHQVTGAEQEKHLQVWSSALPGVLWHKENLISVAIQHISVMYPDFRYVAWVDADIKFEAGALEQTAQALQHWDVVQMWSHAIDFCPKGGVLNNKVHLGFMYAYWNNIKVPGTKKYDGGGQAHPGWAWAARREALNKLGGLIDWGILGSGDRHMACALNGRVQDSVHGKMHPTYHKWLNIWQERAEREIKRNVGYVDGTIRHWYHGEKSLRGYSTRWQILVKHQFNPETDIKKDVYGLWQLVVDTPRQRELRDDIRKYFKARKEDALVI